MISAIKKTVLLLSFCMSLVNMAFSAQKEGYAGLAIGDKDAWKIVWANDSKTGWKVTTSFVDAHVTYFFKNGPTASKGLNLTKDNPPYKIEFRDLVSGRIFVIKDIAYEQWEDGAKTYSGQYEGKFKLGDKKFRAMVVSLVEEVNGAKDYANYVLWKDL